MTAERTFTNVDDGVLARLISQASQRVVFVAPGLREPVGMALASALRRLPGQVTVVLDVDAEVCRLGYGDEKGLELIKREAESMGCPVLHQPGVRIGLLIADADTVVYSPVPLLIEAGSTQPDKPNAIVLRATVPPAVEAACGLGAEGDAVRQVGMDFVSEAAVEAVKEDLKSSPPKEFNVARIERVFNSALHFVEVEFVDYRLRAKKVRLDVELFGMGDEFLRERVENTFKPFDDADFLTVRIPKLGADGKEVPNETEPFGPHVIEQERNRLKKEFLFDIPKFGVVIRRANKQEFEARLKLLQERLKLYVEALKKNINAHLKTARHKLTSSLVEGVKKNPPASWKKLMDGGSLTADEAGRLLDEALDKAFAGIVSEFNPTIRWIYKDVTYETIHEAEFRKGLEKHVGLARAAKLFSEHDVAPEKGTA
jgi:hypothetical protein